MKTNIILSIISALTIFSIAIPCYGQGSQPPRSQWPYPIADQLTFSYLLTDLLEYQRISSVNALRWDVVYWQGGDYQRLWFKSEGALYPTSNVGGEFDFQALYGNLVTAFFDFQAGLRFEQHRQSDKNPVRVFAVAGLQGLLPYDIEIEPALFLSNKGKFSGRFTAERDFLFGQRLVLQSRFEAELAAQEDNEFGVNAGINDLEAGIRLRYEISRELAPYVGVSYRQSYDIVRDRVGSEGGAPNVIQFVAGMRTWF